MSVTMATTDGVMVITLTFDPQSACPPLCQILKGLCYSPVCCSVDLRKVQRTSQSVLGALHIMVGLLNIGLGAILCHSGFSSSSHIQYTGFPYWFGVMFILFGIVSIESEKRPSQCLVIISMILNLAGGAVALTAIVFYGLMMQDTRIELVCDYDDGYRYRYDYEYGHRYNRPSPSPHEKLMKEKCLEGRELTLVAVENVISAVKMFLRGVNGVLIVLAVLELCVAISSAVIGMKDLSSSEKTEDKSPGDPELYKPLLEEVTSNPTV